jgi:hypothetical protein
MNTEEIEQKLLRARHDINAAMESLPEDVAIVSGKDPVEARQVYNERCGGTDFDRRIEELKREMDLDPNHPALKYIRGEPADPAYKDIAQKIMLTIYVSMEQMATAMGIDFPPSESDIVASLERT